MIKTRLVHIVHELKIGGVETAVLSSVKTLSQNYELRIYVLGSIQNNLLSGLTQDEKSVFKQYRHNLFMLPFIIVWVVRDILHFSPNVVISSLWKSHICLFLINVFRKNNLLIVFIHSTKYFHLVDKVFTRISKRIADFIFVDSEAGKKFVVSENEEDRGKVRIISFITKKPKIFRRSFSQNEQIRFLYLGRVHPIKNLSRSVTIISLLVSYGVDCYLDIYGPDGGDLNNVKKLADKFNISERINFLGEVSPEKTEILFSRYNFYMQFSLAEGMAMSVAQAMSHGLVCVVTPVGEIPNYSVHKVSAIHISKNMATQQSEIDLIINILSDDILCRKISKNAFSQFAASQTYSESMDETIQYVLSV